MAIIKKRDLKGMSLEQIEEKLPQFRTEIAKMASQVRSGGAPENSGKVRELRRTVARLLTFKSQLEKGAKEKASVQPPKQKQEKAQEKKSAVKKAPDKKAGSKDKKKQK